MPLARPFRTLLAASLALACVGTLAAPTPALACATNSIPKTEVESMLKEGYFLDRQGSYKLAINVFKKVLKANPNNRKAHYLLANTFWRDDQWTRARQEWEQLLRTQPNDKVGREAALWLKDYGRDAWLPTVRTVAGGEAGFADGPMGQSKFLDPGGMAISSTGNLYIADTGNHRIRRLNTAGKVETVAGTSEVGFADGPALSAKLTAPYGVAIDPVGNIYFTDQYRLRFLTPTGMVGTLAGADEPGFLDGVWSGARFMRPTSICTDGRGNIYVVDGGTTIRRVTPQGEVSLLAGSSLSGYADGMGADARFRYITSIKMLDGDTIIALDAGNSRLREVSIGGRVKSLAGCSVFGYVDGLLENAHFRALSGVAVEKNGSMLVADAGNRAIRRISAGNREVETLAGGWGVGSADGAGLYAKFREPADLALFANNLYVLDRKQHAVRKMVLGPAPDKD